MIIGITGQNASGKGEVSKYLENKGFLYESLSDRIREELERINKKETRENLIKIGNDLREKHGSGILGLRTLDKLEENKKYTIDSIRNPDEVNVLQSKKDFVLIAIEAPLDVRFERLKGRSRLGDVKTLKQFKEIEKQENRDSNKQRVNDCIKLAKYVINNNGTIEQLHKKIDKLLEDLYLKYKRPSWDEYFLEIAKVIGRRATCDRGMFGCVVVKDKHILVTGYVGSPKGLPHCDEVGHQMKTVINEDGSESKHCVRTTHAEQNAICQAAMHGIAIDGSTIYLKMTPCSVCAKMVINSGIKRVVCEKKYHAGQETEELFEKAGIKLEILNEEIEKYKNQ